MTKSICREAQKIKTKIVIKIPKKDSSKYNIKLVILSTMETIDKNIQSSILNKTNCKTYGL